MSASTSSQANVSSSSSTTPPLVSIGILTDIQCADLPNGWNFLHTEQRFYRHAFDATRRAVQVFNGIGAEKDELEKKEGESASSSSAANSSASNLPPCSAFLHFGDLIDGFNAEQDKTHETSERVLQKIMTILGPVGKAREIESRRKIDSASTSQATVPSTPASSASPLPCYHLIGNHELMNFPRSRWADILGMGALSRVSREKVMEMEKEAASAAASAKTNNKKHHHPHHRPHHGHHSHPRSYRFPDVPHEKEDQLTKKMRELRVGSGASSSNISSTAASHSYASAAASKSLQRTSAASSSSDFTSASPLYYDLVLCSRYRLLMMDAYDVSTSGYSDIQPIHPHVTQAHDFLTRENPNENKFSPLNLEGKEKRKVAFNGGFGEAQFRWMESVLEECRTLGQHALICSHVAFSPGSAHISALLWNQDEVLELIHEYKDVVLACLHGHDHEGGHKIDEDGILHHTFEAILTTPDDENCYGRMDFYADHIDFVGTGRMTSFRIEVEKEKRDALIAQQNQKTNILNRL